MLHRVKGDNTRIRAMCLALLALCFLQGCSIWDRAGLIVPNPANNYMRQGRDYLGEGLSDSALAAFGMALEADPEFFDAHMGMADIYRDRGNYTIAANAYERAVKIKPNSFDARYYLAWVQHLAGQVHEAVENYLRALTIKPDSFEANQNLAGAYLQLGRPADALPYAAKATELSPADQSAWANLATAHTMTGQYAEAIEAYRQATELGEMDEPILMGLANAHIKLGHYTLAINVLDMINRHSPSDTAYERIGYAYFKMRRFDTALENFRQSIAMRGEDNTVALNGVGVCLMAQYILSGRDVPAQRDEALAVWRRSLQLRPEQPHIVDLLSRYQRL